MTEKNLKKYTNLSKEDDATLRKITESLDEAYKVGFLRGYKDSLILFSAIFEDMNAKNQLNTKLFVRDIWYKVTDILDKKNFSNIYTLEIPEDSSEELKGYLKKFLIAKNKHFEEGYKKGQLILVKLYLSFNKKFYLSKEALIKGVREKLVEFMKPIEE